VFDSALKAASDDLHVPLLDLWMRYFAFGGNLDVIAIDAYLNGISDVEDIDHDLVTHALNELYVDAGHDHPLAYQRP